MTNIPGSHKFGFSMKALDGTIAETVKVFCDTARHLINKQDYYIKNEATAELVNDIMVIESLLQEIEEMIQEFNQLKALGTN